MLHKTKMDTDTDGMKKECILVYTLCNFLDGTPRKRGRPKKAIVSLEDRYPAITYTSLLNFTGLVVNLNPALPNMPCYR